MFSKISDQWYSELWAPMSECWGPSDHSMTRPGLSLASGGWVWPHRGLSLVINTRCRPLIGQCCPGEPAQPAAVSGTGSSRIFVFGNIFRHRLQTFSQTGADRGSFSPMSSLQLLAVRELKRFILPNMLQKLLLPWHLLVILTSASPTESMKPFWYRHLVVEKVTTE